MSSEFDVLERCTGITLDDDEMEILRVVADSSGSLNARLRAETSLTSMT